MCACVWWLNLSAAAACSTWYCHHWWMRALTHTDTHMPAHTQTQGIFSRTLSSHVCWLNRLTHTLSSSVTFMPLNRPLSIHYCCLAVPDWSQSLSPFFPVISVSLQCVHITAPLHNNMLMTFNVRGYIALLKYCWYHYNQSGLHFVIHQNVGRRCPAKVII